MPTPENPILRILLVVQLTMKTKHRLKKGKKKAKMCFFLLFRETKAYYSVIVTATDNGIIPFARSSTSTLVIYVTDENDNAPILDKNEYVFKLKENSAAETIIGRVSAYDIDIGRNAEIVDS